VQKVTDRGETRRAGRRNFGRRGSLAAKRDSNRMRRPRMVTMATPTVRDGLAMVTRSDGQRCPSRAHGHQRIGAAAPDQITGSGGSRSWVRIPPPLPTSLYLCLDFGEDRNSARNAATPLPSHTEHWCQRPRCLNQGKPRSQTRKGITLKLFLCDDCFGRLLTVPTVRPVSAIRCSRQHRRTPRPRSRSLNGQSTILDSVPS
jgi:hypothetical protein